MINDDLYEYWGYSEDDKIGEDLFEYSHYS